MNKSSYKRTKFIGIADEQDCKALRQNRMGRGKRNKRIIQKRIRRDLNNSVEEKEMRNKERIRPFLEEIAKAWESKVPDWRFGQIMFNFLSEVGDPFHWEDDLFLEKLNKFLEANI